MCASAPSLHVFFRRYLATQPSPHGHGDYERQPSPAPLPKAFSPASPAVLPSHAAPAAVHAAKDARSSTSRRYSRSPDPTALPPFSERPPAQPAPALVLQQWKQHVRTLCASAMRFDEKH